MSYVVSITAHRDIPKENIPIVHAVMKGIVTLPHVDEICFGGARGGDTEALRAALHFRIEKRPKLTVIVPDVLKKQPQQTWEWSEQADEIVELGHEITGKDWYAAFGKRDQVLVDRANSLVAFFNGNYRSGTGKTIRMAETKGIKVTIISV